MISPGFAGAIKLGEVYCFDATDETTEDKPVTMSELKAGIKELNVVPSQVFDVDDFKRDHNPAIGEPMRQYGPLKKSAASDRAELNKLQSGPRLADALKAASLTEEQSKFVEKFAKRTPGLEGLDDDGLKGLIASRARSCTRTCIPTRKRRLPKRRQSRGRMATFRERRASSWKRSSRPS